MFAFICWQQWAVDSAHWLCVVVFSYVLGVVPSPPRYFIGHEGLRVQMKSVLEGPRCCRHTTFATSTLYPWQPLVCHNCFLAGSLIPEKNCTGWLTAKSTRGTGSLGNHGVVVVPPCCLCHLSATPSLGHSKGHVLLLSSS